MPGRIGPGQDVFLTQVMLVVDAAEHWGVLHMPLKRRAVFSDWTFRDDVIAERGTVRFRHKNSTDPLIFFDGKLEITGCSVLPLADLLVRLINAELEAEGSPDDTA